MILAESSKYHGFYQLLRKDSPFIFLRKNGFIAFPIKTENIPLFERSKRAIVVEEINKAIEKYTFHCQCFFIVRYFDLSTSPKKVA